MWAGITGGGTELGVTVGRSDGLQEAKMKAVRFDEYGSVDVLTVADVPRPEPEAGDQSG
jgi:hypothetical protein